MYSETKWLIRGEIFRDRIADLLRFFADLVQRSFEMHASSYGYIATRLVRGFEVGAFQSNTRNKPAPTSVIPRGRNYTGGGLLI